MSLPWIKVYSRLPRHRKSVVLDTLLGRRRTWTHIVELWLWASEECPDGDLSGLPAKVIARAAGWTGNADKFVDALRGAGFLAGDWLHDWDEHQAAHVEFAEARVASPAESNHPDDKLARRRAKAAERSARKRQRDAEAKAERDEGVTDGVTRNAEIVTERDGSVTERDASRPLSVTERDENAVQRARTKKEIKIKIETEREHTSARERDADDARDAPSGELFAAGENPTPSAKPDPLEAAASEVLEHWRDLVWVPTGGDPNVKIEGKGSEGRRKLIRPLLREGWTVERLKRVVEGHAANDYLMGRNPESQPGGWTEVENVFRRSKLEAREKAATAPAPARRTSSGAQSLNVGLNDAYSVGQPGAYLSPSPEEIYRD